jgi:hypothetical protein
VPSYPGSVAAKPSINTSDMSAATAHSVDRGLQWDEIRAIELELGTTPSGAFSTVKLRLEDIETDVALKANLAAATFTGLVAVDGNVVRAGTTTGNQVQAVDIDGGNTAWVSLYGSASGISSLGTRSGRVGMTGSTTLDVHGEAGSVRLISDSGAILMSTAGTERARVNSTGLLSGKTASDATVVGSELLASGGVVSTVSSDGPNTLLNKIGAAIVSGAVFESFRLNNAIIGTITRDAATSAVLFNNTSDARGKTDVGLDEQDGLPTVDRIVIRRFERDGVESVGVFAQELVDVLPHAVTVGGDDMSEAPWQVAYSHPEIIGHLVLAVQQLRAELRAAA